MFKHRNFFNNYEYRDYYNKCLELSANGIQVNKESAIDIKDPLYLQNTTNKVENNAPNNKEDMYDLCAIDPSVIDYGRSYKDTSSSDRLSTHHVSTVLNTELISEISNKTESSKFQIKVHKSMKRFAY